MKLFDRKRFKKNTKTTKKNDKKNNDSKWSNCVKTWFKKGISDIKFHQTHEKPNFMVF